MKILMCNTFHYLRGGADRCFLDMIALLEAQGHEVIPFCMHHQKNLPSPYESYFVTEVDFPSLLSGSGIGGKLKVLERVVYSREAKRQIERLIEDTKPDIAHVHGIAHELSPSILPAIKQAGIPIVQTLHDYKLVCPNTNFVTQNRVCEACFGRRYYNVVRHRCKRNSLPASVLAGVEMYTHKAMQIYEKNVDTFISPSRFLKEKVAQHGIENQIVNIPNFLHLDRYVPNFEGENYFIFFGRLVETKGVRTLLEAMRQVKGADLYIAGTGELMPELKAYKEMHQLDHVHFLGFLSQDKLMPLLKNARFAVVPSEWYENYSMAILESMASGTPVVGAKIGGIPELVIEGETGVLFESGNANQLAQRINELLAEPEKTAVFAKNSRRFVEETNNPDRFYRSTMALYETLVTKEKPAKVLIRSYEGN